MIVIVNRLGIEEGNEVKQIIVVFNVNNVCNVVGGEGMRLSFQN